MTTELSSNKIALASLETMRMRRVLRLDLAPKGCEILNLRSLIALRLREDLQRERADPRKEMLFAKETKRLLLLELRVKRSRIKKTCLARVRSFLVLVENLKKLRGGLVAMTLSSTRRILTLSGWDRRRRTSISS